MNKHFYSVTLLVFSALLSQSAQAHTGLHELNGFISGFGHPFLGLDHLLVMFGVGLWASRLSRVNAGATLGAFLGFMLIGACLALSGLAINHTEIGVMTSVLVVGLLLMTAQTNLSSLSSSLLVSLLVAGFALFHGFAHGSELPLASSAIDYAAGFMLATSLLLVIGLVSGLLLKKYHQSIQVYGLITSSFGLWLLLTA